MPPGSTSKIFTVTWFDSDYQRDKDIAVKMSEIVDGKFVDISTSNRYINIFSEPGVKTYIITVNVKDK